MSDLTLKFGALLLSLVLSVFLPVIEAKLAVECSLNGVLQETSQRCLCNPPWKGSACEMLKIKPSPAGYTGAYGWNPKVASKYFFFGNPGIFDF